MSGNEIKNHNDQNMHTKNHVDRLWLEYAVIRTELDSAQISTELDNI